MRAANVSSRYNFDNVPVADTRLLVSLNSTRQLLPPVLVLNNNKLNSNKCPSVQTKDAPECAHCCVQIERPEFRKRSNVAVTGPPPVNHPAAECFAHCGEKRTVNIELDTKAQLSGKLVILALTRSQNLLNQTIVAPSAGDQDASFMCHAEHAWPFSKFHPAHQQQQLLEPNNSNSSSSSSGGGSANNNNRKQIFYSRFGPNLVASINISSMHVYWNSTLRKETFALVIEPNSSLKRNQQISFKETLLVGEFDCHLAKATQAQLTSGELASASSSQPEEFSSKSAGKIQLLALINREVAPAATTSQKQQARPAQPPPPPPPPSLDSSSPNHLVGRANASTKALEPILVEVERHSSAGASSSSSSSLAGWSSTPTPASVSVSSSSSSSVTINLAPPETEGSPAKRAASPSSMVVTGDDAGETLATSRPESKNDRQAAGGGSGIIIDQRMDFESMATAAAKAHTSSATAAATLHHQNKPPATIEARFNHSDSSTAKIGPTYLTELDAFRLRIRSNSFLILTVSSCFVIFTYTLCLLIVLKSRHRSRSVPRGRSRRDDQRPGGAEGTSGSDHQSSTDQAPLNISQPFNLQMPPATRTRLEMMLKMGGKQIVQSLSPGSQQPSSSETRATRKGKGPGGGTTAGEHKHARTTSSRRQTLTMSHENTFNGGGGSGRPRTRRRHHEHEYDPGISSPRGASHSSIGIYEDNHHDDYNGIAEQSSIGRLKAEAEGQYPVNHFAYGTINVVRAIRHAATLARFRLRNSHYRPNLRVIPESDLEHLQSSSMDETELCANFLNQKAMLENGSLSADQLESLVQDAMSLECSHVAADRTVQNATLFSRPIEMDGGGSSTGEPAVSRSRILKQVKEDHLYEEHI